MALALPILLWLVAVISAFFFTQGWLPLSISSRALETDQHLKTSLALLGGVFVCTQVALGAFLWRYREGKPADLKSGSTPNDSLKLEVLWVSVAAMLFLSMSFFGAKLWAAHGFVGSAEGSDPIHVEVTGLQFRWYFRYPGPDGKFGVLKPELQDASLGNPLGLDPSDAASADDRVSSILVVPAGREIELTLRAQDVIHSFFVPELRFKQDAVPGLDSKIHFTVENSGDYEIVCAELCGLGHFNMNAKLKVLDEKSFQSWLSGTEQR